MKRGFLEDLKRILEQFNDGFISSSKDIELKKALYSHGPQWTEDIPMVFY